MPNLETKVMFHLMMLREFFKLYKVEIEPDFPYLISNVRKLLNPNKLFSTSVLINGRKIELSSSRTFLLPPGSNVEFLSFNGTDGTNAVFNGVNKNYREFHIRRRLSVDVKDDFKTKFSVRFLVKA